MWRFRGDAVKNTQSDPCCPSTYIVKNPRDDEGKVSSLFLNRKGIAKDKYVPFIIPHLIRNKKWLLVIINLYFSSFNME